MNVLVSQKLLSTLYQPLENQFSQKQVRPRRPSRPRYSIFFTSLVLPSGHCFLYTLLGLNIRAISLSLYTFWGFCQQDHLYILIHSFGRAIRATALFLYTPWSQYRGILCSFLHSQVSTLGSLLYLYTLLGLNIRATQLYHYTHIGLTIRAAALCL